MNNLISNLSKQNHKFTSLENFGLRARAFSTKSSAIAEWVFHEPYESTYKNLAIGKNTKVICQGFTGKQVSLSRERKFIALGNISLESSDRIRNKSCWWCNTWQRRPGTFGKAGFQFRCRCKKNNGLCFLTFLIGQSRVKPRCFSNLCPASFRCRSYIGCCKGRNSVGCLYHRRYSSA